MSPLALGIDPLARQLLGGLEQGSPWLTVLGQAGLATAVVDADFRFLRVNQQYAAATGRTPEVFPGRGYFELFPQTAIEAIFRQVRSSGVAHTAQPFLTRANPIPGLGHWNWSLTPFADGNDGKHTRRGKTRYLVLTMQEVGVPIDAELQARRGAAGLRTQLDPLPELPAATLREEKLAASEQRFRGLFNALSSGFALHEIILDAHGKPCDYRFIDLNPAFEAITGLRREDIVGRCAHEVLPQVESRWIERFGAVALTGDCQAFDDFSSDLDRRYRVTAYRPASGQFALIIDDITALRRGEESPAPLAPRCDCEALTALAIERMPQASHLRAAIEDGDLRLDYQPLIAAGSGQVIGSEALLRWRDPARFIAVAEDRGLIAPLAAWLLASACRQMKTWLDAGRALRTVAVKLSPQQFFLRDLPELVGQTLAATGLEAHFLELEISAGTLAEHGDQVAATLGRLRQLGVRLASDDFGSASASPTDLRRFPIDTLKIDRSFIRDIATDAGDAHIAAAIIAMAHSLKLPVIAEGVESAAQFALLEEHGCDYYQGPLFGRPLPAEEFPEHCPVLGR